VRLATADDLGRYVRNRRLELGLTQSDLSAVADVSRRWLSEVEAGKATAEIGLVFRVLRALDVTVEANTLRAAQIDLDEIINYHRAPRTETHDG
jgi:y4mF family transcriptional regulator